MQPKQTVFRTMLMGTLLYSVVIGFFNDYTDILNTRSYSITFALAIVLQILTYLTLQLKEKVVAHAPNKATLIFGVWGIMFVSKFVFLWAIGIIFRDSVQLEGFINILIVVATMLVAQKTLDYAESKLT